MKAPYDREAVDVARIEMETTGSSRQREHYEAIHEQYEEHAYDDASMEYRRRFIFSHLFDGLDLNGKRVADLACGSGHNSLVLLDWFPHAEVTGFDISPKACEAYRRIVRRSAVLADLTRPNDPDPAFDAAMIIGGLHHCIVDLPQTLANIAAMLKPEGWLLMIEPNRQCFLQAARAIWYRMDRYFDSGTERALSHDDIARLARPWFVAKDVRYFGGPAYFLILQSLVLRMHPSAKRAFAKPLLAAEDIYARLPGRFWFPAFMARWQRCPTTY
jgi:ubiquinone/menaquinone biosynthesis C-methylase UbiE